VKEGYACPSFSIIELRDFDAGGFKLPITGNLKPASKDQITPQGQSVPRIENGSYTAVHEFSIPRDNPAIDHPMGISILYQREGPGGSKRALCVIQWILLKKGALSYGKNEVRPLYVPNWKHLVPKYYGKNDFCRYNLGAVWSLN